jgi:hypothetical protein
MTHEVLNLNKIRWADIDSLEYFFLETFEIDFFSQFKKKLTNA